MPAQVPAALVADTLRDLGATHVLGIPDNGSAPLFDLLRTGSGPRLLTVTREGEAFAIAAGLWMGGSVPVVCIQGTGLLESGDALRGTAVRMGVPLLCLVGYRGYATMRRTGIVPGNTPLDPATLRRADVDSAALHLEPTLDAWGIPWEVLSDREPARHIRATWERALATEHPVALLLKDPLG